MLAKAIRNLIIVFSALVGSLLLVVYKAKSELGISA
jgi:hypothetical protein